MGSSSGETSQQPLGPGFRFHPTDEELVSYYLKRKVCGKPLFDAISEIDIYRCEPWDLPDLSRLRTRDREWYFFSALDKKYGCSSRANRATPQGYWKTTGKDRAVHHMSCIVGMKKTLVFHIGRAPRGEKTNWVMHEYRLQDNVLATAGIVQDAFVLCRIYHKSGSGPKNGEQYGAPFVEEEWDDDVLVPKKEIGDEEPLSVVVEQGSVQGPDDYEQHPDVGIKSDDILPVVETDGYDSGNNLDFATDFLEGMLVGINENYSTESHHRQEFLGVTVENNNSTEMQDDAVLFGSLGEITHLEEPLQNYPPGKDGYYLELDDIVNPLELNDCTGEVDDNQFDAPDHDQPLNGDGSFLEMNDLVNPGEADQASEFGMVDDWLVYSDATDDNMEHVESGNYLLDQPVFTSEVDAGTAPASSQALKTIGVEDASNQKLEACGGSKDNNISDTGYEESWPKSLAKRFTNMLGSIPSPPAFAAEYPIEGSIKSVGQNSASHSGSIHVSAGMFFVSGGLRLTGNDKQWSVQKGGNVGFVLSYGMSAVDATTTETISEIPGRAMSIIWRAGLYLCIILVPILAVGFKFGSYIFS